ncbi:hypothetical protein [Gimesia fumaroli]|uniref:Ser-Thr-rich glycosyl-phosphatidyl-inositol-anchored membrane family protein n=1 Tax=Gimesia fumaroli TaxID=2527976 RepID=A0A518IBR1_9PLAN|nr:hypothetical protein [Gimesia fumaroli]QDV50538.1 Ser-Thr-rich glycosyl-phosphatidyl-inositol-anchored membrane family protein [Gimesia fumaroli]
MRLLTLLVVSCCCWGILTDSTQAAAVPSAPVYTSKTQFRIPYHYDQAEIDRLGAREIRLYVSTDRGVTWNHLKSVSPATRKFPFEATQDGEYWFSVRTLDSKNQLHPSGRVFEPGLRVVIDTTPPRLDLDLRQVSPGKVQLIWNAEDQYLDPSKLVLEYSQNGSPNWQRVIVAPHGKGQTTWSISQGGVVAVRGIIKDKADNVGSSQKQIRVVASASRSLPKKKQDLPDFNQPIAQGGTLDNSLTLSEPEPLAPYSSQGQDPQSTQPKPFEQQTPLANNQQLPSVFPKAGGGNQPMQDSVKGQFVADAPENRPHYAKKRYPASEKNWAPERKQVLNGTQFQIGFQVDEVGPSGIGAIELYITEDNGQKWYKYGEDEDKKSPFHVEVPHDGIYGFALRVRSGVGLADALPKPGEKPDVVIVVDRTAPAIKLHPIKQGLGGEANKVTITWAMSDQNPAEKSIAINYSTQPNGPWEPIVDWQEDTGRFTWSVGPGNPSKFYLQVVARDSAGNISKEVTPDPIILDLTKPSGRIVDVEVLNKAPY